MKLVFDISTEYDSHVAVIDIDKEGLQQLLGRMKTLRDMNNADLEHMAYSGGVWDLHRTDWDEDFDPDLDGDVRIANQRINIFRYSITWEFWIKHVEGPYETSPMYSEDIEKLIETPRDIWYGLHIQSEIDHMEKIEKEAAINQLGLPRQPAEQN